jgi:hypothetical protein
VVAPRSNFRRRGIIIFVVVLGAIAAALVAPYVIQHGWLLPKSGEVTVPAVTAPAPVAEVPPVIVPTAPQAVAPEAVPSPRVAGEICGEGVIGDDGICYSSRQLADESFACNDPRCQAAFVRLEGAPVGAAEEPMPAIKVAGGYGKRHLGRPRCPTGFQFTDRGICERFNAKPLTPSQQAVLANCSRIETKTMRLSDGRIHLLQRCAE